MADPNNDDDDDSQRGVSSSKRRSFLCPRAALRTTPSIITAPFHPQQDKVVWEDFEDELYILLNGRLDRFQICQYFYFQRNIVEQQNIFMRPGRFCDFLWSLGYLISEKDQEETNDDMMLHDEHVSKLASFLTIKRNGRYFVRVLYHMCSTAVEKGKQGHLGEMSRLENSPPASERLYDYLTTPTLEHEIDDELLAKELFSLQTLLYELRAKCLRQLDTERSRARAVSEKGDHTAIVIATGAKIVELGVQKLSKTIEGEIGNVGQKTKVWIDDSSPQHRPQQPQQHEPQQQCQTTTEPPPPQTPETPVAGAAFFGSTKRASEYVREKSQWIAQSTLDTTTNGLYTIGNKIEDSADSIDHQLPPETLEKMKAACKIGVASVGAAGLVVETVVDSTWNLSTKTVEVTADVVGHKYGDAAGEVAQDAADTYRNVVETMKSISLATKGGSEVVKATAKHVGKNQIEEDFESTKQSILEWEQKGARVAKRALGIQWAEGSLTQELLRDSISSQ